LKKYGKNGQAQQMNPDSRVRRKRMKMKLDRPGAHASTSDCFERCKRPFHELFLVLVVLNRKARKAICSTRSLFYALIKFLLEELIQSVHTSPGTIPANDATCAARRLRAAPR
jgi:hypothetical protein